MGEYEKVARGVYQVGGSDLSDPSDAAIYVVEDGSHLAMIDCGAGMAPCSIVENIEEAGLDPRTIETLILTHCHVDHIGSVSFFRERYGCTVVAHDLDADPIERGDPGPTAAGWYGVKLPRVKVDRRLYAGSEVVLVGETELHCLHTPGHTPGSVSVYLDRDGTRILFGQDIHGPFSTEFGSDMTAWRASMEALLALGADILCEGHFGIYAPRERVERYIRGYLDRYARRW
ncbi:MAG TPA: MBL fold metallo-hydrolase [Deltaproteobacteria bacterium]|nr:MBL fold metallo-hydrolase [Deltaproteobacteria bacterium]HPP80424.1 MBL fold metallo-hydrolase [Deltaproteobacteria bacterium]